MKEKITLTEFTEKYGDIYINEKYFKRKLGISDCKWKFKIRKRKVTSELKKFALKYNDEKIMWEDTEQPKIYLYYDYDTNQINCKETNTAKTQEIYFTDWLVATEAMLTIGEGRLKKYYFGVE